MATNVWRVRLCNTFFVRFQVYYFRGPVFKKLKERIIRILQGFWRVATVSSEEVQQWYTKSRVLYVGKVTTMSQSALFSLLKTQFHAHRPMIFRTTLSFPSIYIHLPLVQVSVYLEWRFVGGSFPRYIKLFRIRLPWGDLQSCFVFNRIWSVSTVGVSLSSTLSYWFSPMLRWPPRLCLLTSYLLSSFVPLPSSRLIFHVQLVISIRSVD